MILFVDYEHPSAHDKPHGERVLAARTWISYRLQEITGHVCLLQPYPAVTPELLERHDIAALFISGQSADVELYDPAELAGLETVIAARSVPMFGFCGGHQLIAATLGSELRRIGRSTHEKASADPTEASHWIWEFGYEPIELIADHELLHGLGNAPVFRHAHSFEIDRLPPGFSRLASTNTSADQLIVHDDDKIVSTQFHPEYYTDEHPAGRRLIQNFAAWAGL